MPILDPYGMKRTFNMKRSEMIQEIINYLTHSDYMSDHNATVIAHDLLTLVESKGMLPPPRLREEHEGIPYSRTWNSTERWENES